MKTQKNNSWLANLLIIVATLGRLLPHPANFTPVEAVSLVGGAKLSKINRWFVPFIALFLSDLLLKVFFNTTPFSFVTLFIYASFAINILLGQQIGGEKRYLKLGTYSLIGGLQFFLITNFGVWMEGLLYAPTAAGLAQCYAMALPFLKNTLLGNLCWSFGLFFAIERSQLWIKNRSLSPSVST